MKPSDARLKWIQLMVMGGPNWLWYRIHYGEKKWRKLYEKAEKKYQKDVKKYEKLKAKHE
jgi:hypothetical protein